MRNLNTREKISAGLGALAFCSVLAAPASAQQAPTGCIHFQTSCSDAPYPITNAATTSAYNMPQGIRSERYYEAQGAGLPRPCIHFQTSCSDAPYPFSR
jgi:hypothetical protein